MSAAFWIILAIGIICTAIPAYISYDKNKEKNRKKAIQTTFIITVCGVIATIALSIVANTIYDKIKDDPNSNISSVESSSTETTSSSPSSTTTESTNDSTPSSTPATSNLPLNVTLEPNDGTTSCDSITVYFGENYPELKEPRRDYYTFEGWYTSKNGGYKVEEGDIVKNSYPHTLYAHWMENNLSDWVLESDMPYDAKIEEVKWTYTLTEIEEFASPSVPGWMQTGSHWKQIGTGNHTYANFPSNFDGKEYCDSSDQFYKAYNYNAYTDFETETTKREISNEQVKSYIYYHWVYALSGYHSETNRIIGEYRGKKIYNSEGTYHGTADIWESFEGDYVEYDPKYDAYVITGHSTYSYCWNGRIPVYIQSYTDYEKVYQYKREVPKESRTEVTANDRISNVKKLVRYRIK